MDKRRFPWLDLTTIAFVFLSALALKSTFQYSSISMIIPITAMLVMPIGEWLDQNISIYKKATTACTVVFTLSLPILIQQIGLIDTVIGLFIYVQIFSLIHTKMIANYYHIMLMAFFILIASLVMSPSASMGLVMLGYLICTFAGLLLIDRRQKTMNTSKSSQVHYARTKYSNDTGNPTSFAVVPILTLFFITLLGVMSAIFVVMPRTEAGFLGSTVQTRVYTTELSESVELNLTSTLENNASPVMHVRFTSIPNGKYNKEMYWRATTMDKYSGTSWSRQGLSTRGNARNLRSTLFQNLLFRGGNNRGARRQRIGQSIGKRVDYEIFMDNYPKGGFPLLSTIQHVVPNEDSRDIRLFFKRGGDFTVNINYRNKVIPYFTALSIVPDSTPDELRNSRDDYLNVMVPSDYRLLTEQDLLEATIELTKDITRNAQTNYDRVASIEAYLTGPGFEYTKEVPSLSTDHPTDDFIQNVRLGHCELYASSMALMIRSLGIPARVVSGYRGGEWDSSDKSYTITMNMAHLWVEVYFPDYGWITFDPSPAVSEVQKSMLERIQNAMARYSIRARILWLKYVIGFSPNDFLLVMRDQTLELIRNVFASNSTDDLVQERITIFDRAKGVLFLLFIAAAFGLVCFAVYRMITADRRVSRYSLTAEQEHAKRLYAALLVKLETMGIPHQNRTAEELLEQLKGFSDALYAELRPFVRRYHDARFGSKHLTTEELAQYKKLIVDLGKT